MSTLHKLIITLLFLLSLVGNAHSSTLSEIRESGELKCGVNGYLPGFSFENPKGEMSGIDVDFCRAVAAAIGVNRVKFIKLNSAERLIALKNNKIDLLSSTTTWNLTRDRSGYEFVGSIYYDGEGFMIDNSIKYNEPKDLEGLSFCVRNGTTSITNLANYFGLQNIGYTTKTYKNQQAVEIAYLARECDVYVLDVAGLVATLSKFDLPEEHKILNLRISKEPLSPVVLEGDGEWIDIVRWTLFLLIGLEENDIHKTDFTKEIQLTGSQVNFLTQLADASTKLNLDRDWALRVVKLTGSYGDIFSTNLGMDSSLKIERGMNNLWSKGGLLFSPPFN